MGSNSFTHSASRVCIMFPVCFWGRNFALDLTTALQRTCSSPAHNNARFMCALGGTLRSNSPIASFLHSCITLTPTHHSEAQEDVAAGVKCPQVRISSPIAVVKWLHPHCIVPHHITTSHDITPHHITSHLTISLLLLLHNPYSFCKASVTLW